MGDTLGPGGLHAVACGERLGKPSTVLGSVLCAVIDAQNFNRLLPLVDAVDGDIGQRSEQDFSGAYLIS